MEVGGMKALPIQVLCIQELRHHFLCLFQTHYTHLLCEKLKRNVQVGDTLQTYQTTIQQEYYLLHLDNQGTEKKKRQYTTLKQSNSCLSKCTDTRNTSHLYSRMDPQLMRARQRIFFYQLYK